MEALGKPTLKVYFITCLKNNPMSILERWRSPTPRFFKKIFKWSVIIIAATVALMTADAYGKSLIPNFTFTLHPTVLLICKNLFVGAIVAAAVSKAATVNGNEDPGKKPYSAPKDPTV